MVVAYEQVNQVGYSGIRQVHLWARQKGLGGGRRRLKFKFDLGHEAENGRHGTRRLSPPD